MVHRVHAALAERLAQVVHVLGDAFHEVVDVRGVRDAGPHTRPPPGSVVAAATEAAAPGVATARRRPAPRIHKPKLPRIATVNVVVRCVSTPAATAESHELPSAAKTAAKAASYVPTFPGVIASANV